MYALIESNNPINNQIISTVYASDILWALALTYILLFWELKKFLNHCEFSNLIQWTGVICWKFVSAFQFFSKISYLPLFLYLAGPIYIIISNVFLTYCHFCQASVSQLCTTRWKFKRKPNTKAASNRRLVH